MRVRRMTRPLEGAGPTHRLRQRGCDSGDRIDHGRLSAKSSRSDERTRSLPCGRAPCTCARHRSASVASAIGCRGCSSVMSIPESGPLPTECGGEILGWSSPERKLMQYLHRYPQASGPQRRHFRGQRVCLVAGSLAAPVSAAPSEPVAAGNRLVAKLDGSNEVPGPGDRNGSGKAVVRLKPEMSKVCARVSVDRIGDPIAASIHRGALV